ncbi:MAG: hypothetical protein EAZ27_05540 [Cytophagales bacterium]|nr:MAG: hypothetical protein EAZ27_05540 [Cytophagales bacterium]
MPLSKNPIGCCFFFIISSKLELKSDFENQVIENLQLWKPHLHTMTSDNGKEFAVHRRIAKH